MGGPSTQAKLGQPSQQAGSPYQEPTVSIQILASNQVDGMQASHAALSLHAMYAQQSHGGTHTVTQVEGTSLQCPNGDISCNGRVGTPNSFTLDTHKHQVKNGPKVSSLPMFVHEYAIRVIVL